MINNKTKKNVNNSKKTISTLNSKSLTKRDYEKILDYYKIKIPSSVKLMREKADKILSEKLCRCIKKVDTIIEAKAIGVCTKNIFNRKGLTRGKFNCKGKQNITYKKK